MKMTALSRILGVFAILAIVPLANAQTLDLLIDDYNSGDMSPYFQFSGGEGSILSATSTTPDGSAFALQFETDGDDYGGFTGFGRGVPGAPYNTSGLTNPYLVFDMSANVPMTVEVNLQTAGDTESRNAVVVSGTGVYKTYALAFSSFLQSQANPFDPTMLNNVVFAIINLAGDANSATAESVLRLDNLRIVEAGTTIANDLVVMDFDDGDFSPYFFFAGADGIVASTTADTPDSSPLAMRGEVDGDDAGGFVGFGRTVAGSPIDVTGFNFVNLYMRTNGPALFEVNLQSGAGEESREAFQVGDTGGDYHVYSIPIDAFIQSAGAPVDLSAVENVVFAFSAFPGDANSGTNEFVFDMDQVGFSGAVIVPVELTAFVATSNGDVVNLIWETASETNNAGFEVETLADGSWTTLGFVEGSGTTTEARSYSYSVGNLEPGTYAFRLKQIDFDGTFEYTHEVEATVEVPGSHTLSAVYPNPFNPQATFTLAVSRTQNVTATLYDALGREVTRLLDARVEADAVQTVRIDGSDLASGVYLIRVVGDAFAETRQISLLR